MYALINTHIKEVLKTIKPSHISEYEWLIQNLGNCGTPTYRSRYKQYWRMNAARLHETYCDAYFQRLQAAKANRPTVGCVANELYDIPTHSNGRQGLQFTFASQLVHMTDPAAPIYGSMVAAFYFFEEPDRNLPLGQRISALSGFHAYLEQEYRRVLANKLLAPAITAFRQKFVPSAFTDEKVIDSLIRAFVALLRNGGLKSGQIVYG